MKTHFLPSEQRARVTRFRAAIKSLVVVLVIAIGGLLASAFYVVDHPATIRVPQLSGSDGTSHDVALVAPQWVISATDSGEHVTVAAENWQSDAVVVKKAEINGNVIALYKLTSPDSRFLGTLQYPGASHQVLIPGTQTPMTLTVSEDGNGRVDQDISAFTGRPIAPLDDPTSVEGVVGNSGSVITTAQLLKAFPELAR